MSANNYRPHIKVLPEDNANRDIATGFKLHDPVEFRQLDILKAAGGWPSVRQSVQDEHIGEMRKFPDRFLVLLVDFDSRENRRLEMTKDVPDDLIDRIFVIGVSTEPEDLQRQRLGSNEHIGKQLARECRENRRELWNHDLLADNAAELDRMNDVLRSILFPAK